jgi:phage terminase large subunit-like protein
VRDKSLELGIRFDPWQDGVGRIILSKRADGTYATSVGGVVISIPRQVGKTYLFGAIVFALCLLVPGLTVIWTAHRLRTADETFTSMVGMTRRKKIAPYIDQVFRGSGDEEIRFRNGSRILFGARERGFGRGFAKVDVLVFDEAQILTENAIDDMVPATNQAPNPLLLFSGTPPKPIDPGEVFTAKRDKALAGHSDGMAYVEFSADEGADPDDRKQWSKANPSYPQRTPADAILRMRENLSEESFLREALGIWGSTKLEPVIPFDLWELDADGRSSALDPVAFAVDVPPGRETCSVAMAGRRADGLAHVEVVDHRKGTGWAVERLAELQKRWKPVAVVLDPSGPAGSLLPDLEAAGVKVTKTSATDMGRACGMFYDAATEGRLKHLDQPVLNSALGAARKRNLGDAWAWHRRDLTDISPLVACTLALFGHATTKPEQSFIPRRVR